MRSESEILQRWQDLREMLIEQLRMFETGALSLHSNNADVTALRIDDLKRQIFDFEGLIASRLRPLPGIERIRADSTEISRD